MPDSRYTIEQIGDQHYLVLDEGVMFAAVWKAPSPYSDWYWGKVTLDGDHYNLMAFDTAKTRDMAFTACCLDSNRKYLSGWNGGQ